MPALKTKASGFILFALLLALAVPVSAGTQLFAGFTMPMGDLNDGADMGYHGGMSMHFPVVPLTFSAGPTVIYNRLPGPGDDDNFTFLEILATGRLSVPAGPMIFGGVGYSFPGAEINGIDLDPDKEFTVVLGTGTKLALLEIKGLWHHVGDSSFLTISAGLGF